MSNPRYPEEFKIEEVKQVTERGLPVAEVAARLEGLRLQTGYRRRPGRYGGKPPVASPLWVQKACKAIK